LLLLLVLLFVGFLSLPQRTPTVVQLLSLLPDGQRAMVDDVGSLASEDEARGTFIIPGGPTSSWRSACKKSKTASIAA